MERELAKRKQEVEALKKELTSFPTEEEKLDKISQAYLRLKEDLLPMSPTTPYTVAVRQDVASEKRSVNTPENYEFDTEGKLANLDLKSVGPVKGF